LISKSAKAVAVEQAFLSPLAHRDFTGTATVLFCFSSIFFFPTFDSEFVDFNAWPDPQQRLVLINL